MDGEGNPVPNGAHYSRIILREEGGGERTLESPLLVLGSTPDVLLQHKHTLTNGRGFYRIPREPLDLILP